MTTKTLQDIYNACYGIIAQGQDATAYPTTLMLSFINKAQNDICYGNVVNLQTNERLEKQALTFLERNSFYTTYIYATVTTAPTIGNTTLACTNQFPTSGYVWINGDIISYSGNDGATLSWIPATGDNAIKFAHQAWTRVFPLYTLPTDFWQMSRAFLTIQNSMTRRILIGIDDRDLSNPIPNSFLYNYLNSNWSTSYMVGEAYYSLLRAQYFFPLTWQLATGSSISFEYQKKPTQFTTDSDLATIPDDYVLNTIPYMACAEILMNRWEADEAIKLNNFWFQNIKNMYQFYTTQRNELQYNERVRTWSDGYLAI